MKKTISAILVVTLLLALVGCGSAEPQSVTLVYEESGVHMEQLLEANGDKCHTMTQTTTIDCTGWPEEQMQLLEEAVAEYSGIYAQYEGVTYSTKTEGSSFSEILVLDISNADLVKSLSEAGLLPIEGEAKYISLKQSVDNMTAQGWTVKE